MKIMEFEGGHHLLQVSKRLLNDVECFLYEEKFRPLQPPSGALALGSVIHNILRGASNFKSVDTLINSSKRDLAIDIANRAIKRKPIVWKDRAERNALFARCTELCRTIYPRYFEGALPLIEPETRFDFVVNRRLWFVGYFDRISHYDAETDEWVIVDFKTSSRPLHRSTLEPVFYSGVFLHLLRYPQFRMAVGAPDSIVKDMELDPVGIFRRVRFEYHLLGSGEIVPVRVTAAQWLKLVETALDLQHRAIHYRNQRTYPPNAFVCWRCRALAECDVWYEKRIVHEPLSLFGELPITFFGPIFSPETTMWVRSLEYRTYRPAKLLTRDRPVRRKLVQIRRQPEDSKGGAE